MLNQVKIIQENFENKIKNVNDMKELEAIRNEFIGKNSELITILKSINKVPDEQRKELGSTANQLRVSITEKIDALQNKLLNDQLSKKMEQEKIDLSIPGINNKFGTMHPLNIVIEEISDIFNELGFEMIDGTEVEKDLYNFQYLNLPIGHPARDMQDTFYIDSETVMRTHCTNMTARMLSELAMKKEKDKNLAAVSYGNVYRRDDDDATHSHQFMQIDGFALGEKMSFANLKWVLKYMCKRLFGNDVNIRMRPSFFPFTEPSVEVDISCFRCNSQGCALCKQSGWIEILGSGMVNEQVLTLCGLDSKEVSALAFGIGIERIAMLKFGISNIRNFYENNVEFLEQFKFYAE